MMLFFTAKLLFSATYGRLQVTTGFYQHLTFRFMAMIRGALVGAIFQKLIQSPVGIASGSESPVMTLIGTDVERICETWYSLTSEVWACIIQLGLSAWLLQRQLGAVCIAPILLAIGMLFKQSFCGGPVLLQ